jgi:uncharacterized protein
MSPPWSKPLEVDRLADGGAEVDCAVPLAELPGLRALQGGVAGQVEAHARFGREQDLAVAELTLKGRATLECQRCLQPLEIPLDAKARIALLAAEAEVGRVPEDLEPVLATGGRISMGELITEELLLTLPIVPLHADEGCASRAHPAAAPASETHRPFAGLSELMKR